MHEYIFANIKSRGARSEGAIICAPLRSAGGSTFSGGTPQLKVLHCFDGAVEEAEEFMDLGFYLGIGGKMTRESRGLAEVVRQIPLDKILLETDCPFLTPNPPSGRNSPVNIPLIAQMIADLKGIDIGVVEEITTHNTASLFGLI